MTTPPHTGERVTGWPRYALLAACLLAGTATLYAISQYNYLLFHTLVELFAVAVAVSVFTIGWNTRRQTSGSGGCTHFSRMCHNSLQKFPKVS